MPASAPMVPTIRGAGIRLLPRAAHTPSSQTAKRRALANELLRCRYTQRDLLATQKLGRTTWKNYSGYRRRCRAKARMHCVMLLGEHVIALADQKWGLTTRWSLKPNWVHIRNCLKRWVVDQFCVSSTSLSPSEHLVLQSNSTKQNGSKHYPFRKANNYFQEIFVVIRCAVLGCS